MATSPFALPTVSADNPLAPEYLALERQKKIAELLMQKGQQLPEGQMVSGHYVAPSITQQLNPLLNAYMGGNMAEQNEAKTAKLGQLLRAQSAEENKGIMEALLGSADYQPAVMPQIQRDDMGNVMPAIQSQIGQAPNKQLALQRAMNAQNPMGQSIANTLLAQQLSPKIHTLAEGGTLVQETPEGGIKTLAVNPKENKVTGNLAEAADFLGLPKNPEKWTMQDRIAINQYMTMDANRRATRISVNAGGGSISPEGGFNKKGDWIAGNGAIIPHTEVTKDREVAKTAFELKQALGEISPKDVKASESILGDVTQGGFRGYIARQTGNEALKAQTKINASAVMQVLNNLPPGPASDKDIAQARSSFPGYGDAGALQSWIDNTNQTLDRKLKNVTEKYGSNNWYGAAPIPVTPPQNTNDGFTIRKK